MNTAMDTNHNVIPKPDPACAIGKALNGGYMVQPAEAGPASTKSESTMMTLERKNNQ